MSVKWKQCFLCATNLSSPPKRKRGRGPSQPAAARPFFRYLVGRQEDKKGPLIQNILEEMGRNTCGPVKEHSTSSLRLCQDCEEKVGQVAKLDAELQTTQIKLTNIITDMWDIILGSRRSFNSQIAKQSLKELLDGLHTAVFNASKSHLRIPFVYLETVTAEHDESDVEIKVEVETEEPHEMDSHSQSLLASNESLSDDNEDSICFNEGSAKQDPDQYLCDDNLISAESGVEIVKTENPGVKRKKIKKVLGKEATRKSDRKRTQPASGRSGTPTPAKKTKHRSKPGQRKRRRILDESNRPRPTYHCEICGLSVYKKLFKFEAHLREHETEEKVHSCDKCAVSFSTPETFQFHMDGHNGKYKVGCDVCKTLVNLAELKAHSEEHGVKLLYCSHCSYCAASREKYLSHFRRTHPNGCMLECDLCPRTFSSRPDILVHLHEEHGVLPKLECPVEGCSKYFFDPFLLDMHKRKVHEKEDKVACSVCNRLLASARSLEAHMLQHTGERPFACEECPERYFSKNVLDHHVASVHKQVKFQCHLCGKDFSTKFRLQGHIKVHDGTGFSCPVCHRQFPKKYELKLHQQTHTKIKNFVCEECGKKFGTKDLLGRHMSVHSKEKNWKCNYCPKAFVIKKYLEVHLRIHTGERPYVCKICGKDFNQRPALFIHQKKHAQQLQQS